MTRPGTDVFIVDAPPPRVSAIGADTWFVVGTSERGEVGTPWRVRSLREYERIFGSRQNFSTLYDALDVYFREGGSRAFVSRVVGPAATEASLDLPGATGDCLTLTFSAGAWANTCKGEVTSPTSTTRIINIRDAAGAVLESSPPCATKAALLAWGDSSSLVRLEVAGPDELPAVLAPTVPTTLGADDLAAITTAQWQAALDAISAAYGPGQVSAPSQTDIAVQQAVVEHAAERNRFALLDCVDAADVATVSQTVSALRGTGSPARHGAAFAPWAGVLGVVPGTNRQVPWSAIQAGLIARSDAVNPANTPAAGGNGVSSTALSLTQTWTDDDREVLMLAGVNTARVIADRVEAYGVRTLVNPDTDPNWLQIGPARQVMVIKAQAEAIAEDHVFHVIDGRGLELAAFQGDLAGMLTPYWTSGALFGATAREAFLVDVGPGVNTPETIADGELHAAIYLRTSPAAEYVVIEIVKVPTAQAIPA